MDLAPHELFEAGLGTATHQRCLLNVNGYRRSSSLFRVIGGSRRTNAHRDLLQIATDPDVLLRDFVP